MLKLRVEKVDSALAPYKALPNEILSYIFALTHGEDVYSIYLRRDYENTEWFRPYIGKPFSNVYVGCGGLLP
jgi:hypothetical protein